MPPGSPEARTGRYLRWTVPVSYEPVESLMRRLGAPPFDKPAEFHLSDVTRKYAAEIAIVLAVAAAAALMVLMRILRLNHSLSDQVSLVSERSRQLEQEVLARAAAEDKLRLHARVFSDAQECLLITDAERNIVAINDAALAVTGYQREELLGRNPSVFRSGLQDEAFYREMWQKIGRDGFWSGEVWNRRKNGSLYACILKISELRDENGQLTHYIGSQEDITTLKETQRHLEHMARFDNLTGLPNRNLLHDRMEHAMAIARRSGQKLAVCLLDLDGFKAVNDRLGHDAGDQLLVGIATRLQHALRETDTVARLGGDEFVLLLADIDGFDRLATTLDRVLAATRAVVPDGAAELTVSSSVGLTLYPDDNAPAETLLRHADEAMYEAKRRGRDRYHLFDAASDSAVAEYRQLVQALESALDNNELRVHYQPIVHLPSGRVLGFEALVRWQHPERGLLAPALFLPAVEHTPLICAIDRWVAAQALADLAGWLDAGYDWYISINIAAFHFESEGFADEIRGLLAWRPRVEPYRLQLELLESKALVSLDAVREVIRDCRALGVRTALDDFGTGYASLAYFKRLPVDTLKIDQSFVRGIEDDPENLVIVDNIVRLTRSFQRSVVAEGMETAEIGELLCRFGCDTVQGYGIAKPMPASDIVAWVAAWQPDPRWATAANLSGDLSVIVLENEMLGWVREVRQCIETGHLAIPEREVSDTRWCHFGHWYYGDGAARYGNSPGFPNLGILHDRLHELGWQIVTHVRDGRRDEAQAIFADVERLARQLNTEISMLRTP
jgi:diguanylate cyclase (GGDEF)-like protein/PAS domain S-box-containing protein